MRCLRQLCWGTRTKGREWDVEPGQDRYVGPMLVHSSLNPSEGMIILDACLAMPKRDGTVLRGWWVCGMAFMEEPNGTILHDR